MTLAMAGFETTSPDNFDKHTLDKWPYDAGGFA